MAVDSQIEGCVIATLNPPVDRVDIAERREVDHQALAAVEQLVVVPVFELLLLNVRDLAVGPDDGRELAAWARPGGRKVEVVLAISPDVVRRIPANLELVWPPIKAIRPGQRRPGADPNE